MKSRFTKAALSIVAVAALAAPAVAQARHGSDDPAGHVRHEHHRFENHHRRGDDGLRQIRHHRRGDDGRGHHRHHDGDDGPNHR